jgi:hypothetical protein
MVGRLEQTHKEILSPATVESHFPRGVAEASRGGLQIG